MQLLTRWGYPDTFCTSLVLHAVPNSLAGASNSHRAYNAFPPMKHVGTTYPAAQVLIWDYPDASRPPLALQTAHRANLFGVRFLPCTGDTQIVSGAMDHDVQLHKLHPSDLSPTAAGSPPSGGGGGRAGSGVGASSSEGGGTAGGTRGSGRRQQQQGNRPTRMV